ncbi:MAG: hypothetical protein AAF149_13985 [Bacteroidota bacterium]
MKNIQQILILCLSVTVLFWSCANDDDGLILSEDDLATPSNVTAAFDITNDNTGTFTVTPAAQAASSFQILFGDEVDGEEATVVLPGESAQNIYDEGDFVLTITAVGLTGKTASITENVVIRFDPPENLEVTITTDDLSASVIPSADGATLFDIFFGIDNDEEPLTIMPGDTASAVYPDFGEYVIKTVARGAGAATIERNDTIQITEVILPPGGTELLVNGDFENESEGWTAGVGTDPAPISTESGNSFYSVNITSPNPDEPFLVNLSQKLEIIEGLTYRLRFDAWSDGDRSIIAGIGLSGGTFANNTQTVNINAVRQTYTLTLLADGFGASDARVLFDSNGEAGLVNIDDVSLELFDDGFLVNGDFENGSDGWTAGVGTDPAPVVTEGGNSFYSVDITTPNPDEPFLVNLSQKLEIMQDMSYMLTFDAWSDRDRAIIAGIGLSGGSFANTSETVSITAERQTYRLILLADGFGAADARVLFDSNGEAGLVNIDDVSLVLFDDGLLTNGDFQNGSDSWLAGVGTDPAPVVTENGNTFYSVEITSPNPDEAFLVNLSQKLEIVDGLTYRLSFNAWSDRSRDIIAGIGLSGGDFSNNSVAVSITDQRQTYELTLTADGFGASDARVLFDNNGEAGIVNIDNVSLVLD